jgi:hypothetical protein
MEEKLSFGLHFNSLKEKHRLRNLRHGAEAPLKPAPGLEFVSSQMCKQAQAPCFT